MTNDTHKGWLIEQNWLGEWEATHPDYDPTPLHLYDPPGEDRHVTAKTRADVIDEIDAWIYENEALPAASQALSSQPDANVPSGAVEAGAVLGEGSL